MSNYRTTIIRTVTFLAGLYFFLEFLLSEEFLKRTGVSEYHQPISYGFIAVGAMAIGLGLINIFSFHGGRLLFRKRGWINSGALLIGLAAMMTFAVMEWQSGLKAARKMDEVALLSEFSSAIVKDREASKEGIPAPEIRISALVSAFTKIKGEIERSAINDGSESDTESKDKIRGEVSAALEKSGVTIAAIGSQKGFPKDELTQLAADLEELSVIYGKLLRANSDNTIGKRGYTLLNNGLFIPLGSAMFSLLGFYIAAAAYRAFRVKSLESFLMMAAAVLVMCGQISFTLRLFGGFSEIRDWLLNVPNSAAFRAISIGTSVAGLVLAIRMWLSIESGSFSKQRGDRGGDK